MKKLSLLLVIPALLLVGCKGQKISEDKARAVATKISEKTKSDDNDTPHNFEMIFSADGSSYDEDEGKSLKTDIKYKLSVNEADETRLQAKGYVGKEKQDFCLMSVKKEGYDDNIVYLKVFNEEEDKYEEAIYLDSSDSRVTPYEMQLLLPAFVLATYSDPLEMMEDEDVKNGQTTEGEGENAITYDNTVNYFSRGEGNLTIEATKKYVSGNFLEGNEEQIETKATFTYDNFYIKSGTIKSKSNMNNEMNTSFTVTLKKSKINFELPKNWEEMIAPEINNED